MAIVGLNFRSTIGAVTDPAGTVGVVSGDSYPTTRSGQTFGISGGGFRNRTQAADPRFSGAWFSGNVTAEETFEFDLAAAGTYPIKIASHDAGFGIVTQGRHRIFDGHGGAVLLDVLLPTATTAEVMDADGTKLTEATWDALARVDNLTFTGTKLVYIIGDSTATDTTDSKLTHLEVGDLIATAPTITDIDGDESVYPGQSYIIQATDDIGATQGTVFWERLDGTDDVQHTVTNWDAATDQITVTAVRGGHNYGSGLYQARVVLGDGTTEILFDNAGAGLTLEAQPNTFAVTAASPNTTDDASLWSGLIDTATSNPVTVVDGDQAWVNTILDGLAIAPDGTITANETGMFTVQFWRASEGVWGSDQTVSFTLPAEATDNWPFGKAINPIATKNWTWGSRHPMTGMRVRIFK